MGAQSALMGIAGSAEGVVSTFSKINEKASGMDAQMADYARQMRDAKLQTAKNNAQLSKLRLEKMKKGVQ